MTHGSNSTDLSQMITCTSQAKFHDLVQKAVINFSLMQFTAESRWVLKTPELQRIVARFSYNRSWPMIPKGTTRGTYLRVILRIL